MLWFVPLLAYLAPVELTHGAIGEIAPYLVIELIVVVALCLPAEIRRRPVFFLRRMVFSGGRGQVSDGATPTGRLGLGLETTPFRSRSAAQRPTTGP